MRIPQLIILILFPFILLSQSHRDSISQFNITVSPSALVNVYPGIQLGLEKGINTFGFLEIEGAYLFPVQSNLDIKRHGYRVKLAYKYPVGKNSNFNFIMFLRKTYHERRENFDRFNGLFFEQIDFTKTKRLFGPTMGFSSVFKLFNDSLAEIGVSVGMGQYTVSDQGVPEEADQISGIPLFNVYESPGVYRFPIISIQVKCKFGV